MRILIAEDDLTSRKMLVGILLKCGHEVIEDSRGDEAHQFLRVPDAPRLAILDWMMPGLDGVDVVHCVRALRWDHPPYILMLTIRSEKEGLIAGLNAGANDYLVKPFDARELQARIEVGQRMVDLRERLEARVRELRDAMAHIETLRGILPICSYCKRIRNDRGYWDQLERYICEHSLATFSHGICPDCIDDHHHGLCPPDERGNQCTD